MIEKMVISISVILFYILPTIYGIKLTKEQHHPLYGKFKYSSLEKKDLFLCYLPLINLIFVIILIFSWDDVYCKNKKEVKKIKESLELPLVGYWTHPKYERGKTPLMKIREVGVPKDNKEIVTSILDRDVINHCAYHFDRLPSSKNTRRQYKISLYKLGFVKFEGEYKPKSFIRKKSIKKVTFNV